MEFNLGLAIQIFFFFWGYINVPRQNRDEDVKLQNNHDGRISQPH